jgi:hypothetical protein
LVKIDFDKNNQYDLELEAQWESAVTECRKHTYFINPNNSILIIPFHSVVFTILQSERNFSKL